MLLLLWYTKYNLSNISEKYILEHITELDRGQWNEAALVIAVLHFDFVQISLALTACRLQTEQK